MLQLSQYHLSVSIIGWLLTSSPTEWGRLILDLGRRLYGWLDPQEPEDEINLGTHEFLEYDTTLELVDPYGKIARFTRFLHVRFLQDNVQVYRDIVSAEGNPAGNYHCTPGEVMRWVRQGNHWVALILLPEPKNQGDVERLYFDRVDFDSFTSNQEYWQIEIQHYAQVLKLRLILPRERPCRRVTVTRRSLHKSIVLRPEHYIDMPAEDGRQMVVWQDSEVKPLEIITVSWEW